MLVLGSVRVYVLVCVCIIMLVLGYVRVEGHIHELGSVRVHMICACAYACVRICVCA